MAQDGYPFINNPGSGWHDTGPSSRTVARQLKTATRQQLQQEAASLLPDSQKLSEELMKYNISGGDRTQFVGALNGMMNEYLNSYNENPYFAFTKKGRDISKQMQRLVNHPMLKSLEDTYKKNEAAYEQAQKDGLLSMVNVQNGKVNVYNHKNKRFEFVDPSSIDPNNHEVLSVQDAIYKKAERGFFNPQNEYEPDEAASVTMASYKDVISHINSILQDTGSTESEQFNMALKTNVQSLADAVSRITKFNKGQLDQKARAIFSDAGLPANYWDTLLSTVYTKYRGQKPPSIEQAYMEAAGTLSDIIYGRSTSSVKYDALPTTVRGALEDNKSKEKSIKADIGLYSGFAAGAIGAVDQVIISPNGNAKQARTIGDNLWDEYKGDGVVPSGWLPFNANPVFKVYAPSGETLTTLDGQPLNKAGVIPQPGGRTSIVHGDDGYYLVTDVLASTDALNGDWDQVYNASDLSEEDEMHIERLGKKLKDLRNDKNVMVGFDPYDKATEGFLSVFRTDDYKKVRVKVKINPDLAQDLSHVRLDKNNLKVDQKALSIDEPQSVEAPSPVKERIVSNY
jgi:hypothetical protein